MTVDYIVRVERGTMNRGIFDLAVLFDPTRPWSGDRAAGAVERQDLLSVRRLDRPAAPAVAAATLEWTNEMALSRGYLVAQNSMTDSATNSNRVMMAETVMMMKEHVGDRYGPVKFTMGTGCSGGSINSNMNASIAPGQLDGIVISCAYPDSETTAIEVSDCVVLAEAYQKPAWTALMAGQTPGADQRARRRRSTATRTRAAATAGTTAFGNNGKAGIHVPLGVLNHATGAITPLGGPTNNCQLPPSAGLRSGDQSDRRAVCGVGLGGVDLRQDCPDGSRARDTRDNTGIQYGLKALMAEAISAEEFVTLNEVVGGVEPRRPASGGALGRRSEALEIAYRAGIVMSGRQLAKTRGHRPARLGRLRHQCPARGPADSDPLHLAQLFDSRPARPGVRRPRQPGDVAVRHAGSDRPAQLDASKRSTPWMHG